MDYVLLGKSGLKVSELCLGTMGFGTEWGWGIDQAESFRILEAYAEAGGNFLDTANRYTEGSSEKIIGSFMQSDRARFVVATKYSLYENQHNVNASGNNRKSMMYAVEQSLKRLNTDYIDLLYLHIWDDLTPIEEVMRGLDDLIRQGKVHYIGISDTPAWIIAKGNTYAELMGWSRFVALQVEYSLLQRTPERELLPMARHYGMSLVPWAPLAGGALSGKYLRGERGRLPEQSARLNDRSTAITREVVRIAEELNVPPAHVALQWTRQQNISCIPIAGAIRLNQINENISAFSLKLGDHHMQQLNEVSKIEMGFPHDFFTQDGVRQVLYGGFDQQIQRRS